MSSFENNNSKIFNLYSIKRCNVLLRELKFTELQKKCLSLLTSTSHNIIVQNVEKDLKDQIQFRKNINKGYSNDVRIYIIRMLKKKGWSNMVEKYGYKSVGDTDYNYKEKLLVLKILVFFREIEVKKMIQYTKERVTKEYRKTLDVFIRKAKQVFKIEAQIFGSNNLTSDYDGTFHIANYPEWEAHCVRFFNELFFKEYNNTSAFIFDTNFYTSGHVSLIKGVFVGDVLSLFSNTKYLDEKTNKKLASHKASRLTAQVSIALVAIAQSFIKVNDEGQISSGERELWEKLKNSVRNKLFDELNKPKVLKKILKELFGERKTNDIIINIITVDNLKKYKHQGLANYIVGKRTAIRKEAEAFIEKIFKDALIEHCHTEKAIQDKKKQLRKESSLESKIEKEKEGCAQDLLYQEILKEISKILIRIKKMAEKCNNEIEALIKKRGQIVSLCNMYKEKASKINWKKIRSSLSGINMERKQRIQKLEFRLKKYIFYVAETKK